MLLGSIWKIQLAPRKNINMRVVRIKECRELLVPEICMSIIALYDLPSVRKLLHAPQCISNQMGCVELQQQLEMGTYSDLCCKTPLIACSRVYPGEWIKTNTFALMYSITLSIAQYTLELKLKTMLWDDLKDLLGYHTP